MTPPGTLRLLAAILLLVASATFVIGVISERAAEDDEDVHADAIPAAGAKAESSDEHAAEGEGGESAETDEEGEEHDEAAEAAERGEAEGAGGGAGQSHSEAEETAAHVDEGEEILGIDPESTAAVAAAVAVSLLLAGAIWFWGGPIVLLAAAAFALLFAVLDIREAIHQADESRGGLVMLALLIALLHLGAAVAASLAWRRSTEPTAAPA